MDIGFPGIALGLTGYSRREKSAIICATGVNPIIFKGGNSMRYATFLLLAAIAGPAFAEDIALDDNAITTMVKGKRLGATGPSAASFRLTFKDDGTLAGNEGHTVDKGTWRVEGGKLCITWEKWKYDGCGKLVKAGNEVKFFYPAQDDKIYLTFN
jgi:hypothetical protein